MKNSDYFDMIWGLHRQCHIEYKVKINKKFKQCLLIKALNYND